MAEPEEAQRFCGDRAPGILCLSDPQRTAFRAFGIGLAGPLELMTPDVFFAGAQATLEGHLPGPPTGDVFQMPAAFVIGADGRVRLAYYSRNVADYPHVATLLAALA